MKQEKDTILYSPKDTIINTDLRNKYMENMRTYSIFVLFDRAAPSIYDGLKSGQRRILYCMLNDIKCVSKATKRKSAATCGAVIGEYHPHSSDAIYDTQKKMSNWFECKAPLINYYGNSGSVQGETRFSA